MRNDYNHVKMSDLRYDLEGLEGFKTLDIGAMPDDMVILIHHQITSVMDEDIPDWYKDDVELWLNLERNAAIDNQAEREKLQSEINGLKARLGDLEEISDEHYREMFEQRKKDASA